MRSAEWRRTIARAIGSAYIPSVLCPKWLWPIVLVLVINAIRVPVSHAQTAPSLNGGAPRAIPPSELPLRWKRWPLFDPFVDSRERGAVVTWTEWREVTSNLRSVGATIAIADQVSTIRRPWAVTLATEAVALSLLEGPVLALGLAEYQLLGSLDAGSVRIGAGAGLLPMSMDYAEGDFSIAIASPRAIAAASFKLGTARVLLSAHTGYLPRLFGRGHAITQGLSITLLIEQKRTMKRGNHPLVIDGGESVQKK